MTTLYHKLKFLQDFFLKIFRFNYQLLWVQQDQSAYINYPQTFDPSL